VVKGKINPDFSQDAVGVFTELSMLHFNVSAKKLSKKDGHSYFQTQVVKGLTQEQRDSGGKSIPVAGPTLLGIPGIDTKDLTGQQVDRTPPDMKGKVPFEVDERLRPGVKSAFSGTGPTVREEPHLPKPRASKTSGSSSYGKTHPEAAVELPDQNQVILVEATLDAGFRLSKEESTASHKEVQIPATILNAASFYKGEPGKKVKFIYAIFSPSPPTEEAKSHLKQTLQDVHAKGISLDITWIVVRAL
jgi:hypothetical protein